MISKSSSGIRSSILLLVLFPFYIEETEAQRLYVKVKVIQEHQAAMKLRILCFKVLILCHVLCQVLLSVSIFFAKQKTLTFFFQTFIQKYLPHDFLMLVINYIKQSRQNFLLSWGIYSNYSNNLILLGLFHIIINISLDYK